jgi:Fic family protein
MTTMFEEVESRRRRLDAYKPFDDQMVRRLNAIFEPWFIYNSNALEGNTLSLGDTIYVIREGRLPGGKTEDEYLEVKGQQAAYAYLQEAVRNAFPLSEKLIRELHQLLTEKLDIEKFELDTSAWSERIRLSLDPSSWRETDIERFLVKGTQRFLRHAEIDMDRLNHPAI